MAVFTDKKRKIVLAAISEFAHDGFEKASIDRIALKAKVAKGTVFYHFKSKQDLFDEIIKEGQKTFEEIVTRKIVNLKSERKKIGEIIRIEFNLIRKYRDLFSVYLGDMIKKVTNFGIIEKILLDGVKGNEFRGDLDVKTVAVALFWTTAMITLNSNEAKVEEIENLVLKGIEK